MDLNNNNNNRKSSNNSFFLMNILDIQPSQLYINEDKLKSVNKKYFSNSNDKVRSLKNFPIPIKKLNGRIIFTDGHTRAYVAFLKGFNKIPVIWDDEDEDLDWEIYEICVQWCEKRNIFSVKDFKNKIISNIAYQKLWIGRCKKLDEKLRQNRNHANK